MRVCVTDDELCLSCPSCLIFKMYILIKSYTDTKKLGICSELVSGADEYILSVLVFLLYFRAFSESEPSWWTENPFKNLELNYQ